MISLRCARNVTIENTVCGIARAFSASTTAHEKPLPPRMVILESDITESFLKGTGPGGQKINKTSSAVQLKHIPTGIVVKSQETRSREQNRRTARRILGEKLEELEKGSQSRTAIKAETARKKKASAAKKSRRKYKKLDEERASASRDDAESSDEEEASHDVTADSKGIVEVNEACGSQETRRDVGVETVKTGL